MNVDTSHLLITQVKSEVDTLHNENSSSSVNAHDAGNIQDMVISHIKQEADIFYDENICTGSAKSPKCENAEDMVKVELKNKVEETKIESYKEEKMTVDSLITGIYICLQHFPYKELKY